MKERQNPDSTAARGGADQGVAWAPPRKLSCRVRGQLISHEYQA